MKRRITMMFFYIITIFSGVIFAQTPVITKEPENKYAIEGQTATFFIQAAGDSILYQWYKNDTLIVGATDSIYTTPATVFSDNLSKFNCIVTNSYGTDTSAKATLYVTAAGSRVTTGMQLLYKFNEGNGTTLNDSSGVGTPYNLGINNKSSVTWTPNGLGINEIAYITGSSSLSKVIDASKLTNEITIEVWIQPATVNLDDYTRILTLSDFKLIWNKISLLRDASFVW